jgi:hypothetical protein
MMKLLAYLLPLSLGVSILSPGAAEAPIRLKVFGRPRLGDTQICVMGWSADAIKKLKDQQERTKTVSFWCKENSIPLGAKYRRVFKNNPVSYKVTFDGKSDMGTLHLMSPATEQAENMALEIFREAPLLTTPETDLPYRSGILIKFTSLGVRVTLASKRAS